MGTFDCLWFCLWGFVLIELWSVGLFVCLFQVWSLEMFSCLKFSLWGFLVGRGLACLDVCLVDVWPVWMFVWLRFGLLGCLVWLHQNQNDFSSLVPIQKSINHQRICAILVNDKTNSGITQAFMLLLLLLLFFHVVFVVFSLFAFFPRSLLNCACVCIRACACVCEQMCHRVGSVGVRI